jgi:maleylpyruvate isomerase
VLVADLTDSASAFAAEAARLNGADWSAEVHGRGGRSHPGWYTVWRRLSEVEIHHVDLGAGYRPADWPADFAAQRLAATASEFQVPECPRVTLRAADSGAGYEIGAGDGTAPLTVTGPTRQVLAWLIGRSDGAGLAADPAGPLPALPSF